MTTTIKAQATTLLLQYGWLQTTRNGVECFVDPLDRTKDAIYLGQRGSIRKGPNKSESKPLLNGLPSLERYLKYISGKITDAKAEEYQKVLEAMPIEQRNALMQGSWENATK